MQPDAKHLRTDPQYLASLIAANGMTPKATAEQIGVPSSVLRNWLAGIAQWPYTAQYAIESLAQGLAPQTRPDASQRTTGTVRMRHLVEATGMAPKVVADLLGVNYSTLKRWTTTGDRPSKWPYSAQYALERMSMQ